MSFILFITLLPPWATLIAEFLHGREELRACWVLTDLESVRERAKWPGLQSGQLPQTRIGQLRVAEVHYDHRLARALLILFDLAAQRLRKRG